MMSIQARGVPGYTACAWTTPAAPEHAADTLRYLRHPPRRFAATLLVGVLLSSTASARMVVDRVIVEGKSGITSRLVSARMSLYPGDRVDFETLADAQQRLIASDLFTSARVYVDLPTAEAARLMYVDAAEHRVDLHVVLEAKTSWFIVPIASFGAGDLTGGLAYGDRNFAGRDVQVVAAAQIGQALSYAFAGYRDPQVVGAALTWAIAALYRLEKIRYFVDHEKVLEVPTTIWGGEAEIGWVLTSRLRALVGFSARNQGVEPGVVLVPDAPQPAYNPAEGRIFLLVFQVRYDATSAPDGLRRGVRLLLKNEISDRYWGSQFDYSKFEVKTELYGQLGGWNYPSIALNAVFDYPTSSRGVPITETLRIGGANLRGYLTDEFHGDTLVSAQLEDQAVIFRGLPIPFVKSRFNIAAAAFVDVAALLDRHPGGTTVESPNQPRPVLDDYHIGVGIGLRIILPGVAIPALKADLGYGIDVRSFAVTVSIGGGG